VRPERLPILPDVPAQSEFGGDPGLNIYFGIFGPANMPPAVVEKLAAEFAKAIQAPKVAELLQAQHMLPAGNPPDEVGAYLEQARNNAQVQFKAFGIEPVDQP